MSPRGRERRLGGVAAAVADGLLPIGEGSDAGGLKPDTRRAAWRPFGTRLRSVGCASWCALTRSALPGSPLIFEAPTTQTVEDAVRAPNVLASYDAGGWASEAVIFAGEASTGAGPATCSAQPKLRCRWSPGSAWTRPWTRVPIRSAASAPVASAGGGEAFEATEREIDMVVHGIVKNAFRQAIEFLRRRRAGLDEGALLPLAQEPLTADQFPATGP